MKSNQCHFESRHQNNQYHLEARLQNEACRQGFMVNIQGEAKKNNQSHSTMALVNLAPLLLYEYSRYTFWRSFNIQLFANSYYFWASNPFITRFYGKLLIEGCWSPKIIALYLQIVRCWSFVKKYTQSTAMSLVCCINDVICLNSSCKCVICHSFADEKS